MGQDQWNKSYCFSSKHFREIPNLSNDASGKDRVVQGECDGLA